MSATSSRTLTSSLSKLNISASGQATLKSLDFEPAESWEDDADSDTETEMPQIPTKSRPSVARLVSSDLPGAPPPTPASPSFSSKTTASGDPFQTFPPYGMGSTVDPSSPRSKESSSSSKGGDDKRPEKSVSVASRLIAAGIGQAAPKRTKEQKEYDQAMRLQEKKKRDLAKADEAKRQKEKEDAIKAVWED